jgi:hypothetical protein
MGKRTVGTLVLRIATRKASHIERAKAPAPVVRHTPQPPLDGAKVPAHQALRAAHQALDDAVLACAGDPRSWAEGLEQAVRGLAAVFRRHCDIAECEGGILDQLVEAKPWLGERVRARRLACPSLLLDLGALEDDIRQSLDGGHVDTHQLRRKAVQVQDAIQLHQARLSDLIFDAFCR